MRILPDLFFSFARISCSCFGGGYAMLPFFQSQLVERRGWMTDEELLDLNALAQCTPGVMAVNTSTFCGYRVAGIPGAFSASLGMLCPPVIIVTLISALLWHYADVQYVRYALAGVRACVCALILNSTIKLGRKAVLDIPSLLICLFVFLLAAFAKMSPVFLILSAGIAGLIVSIVRRRFQ